MHYTSMYNSPVGEILLAADDTGVVGVWFKDEKYMPIAWIGKTSRKKRRS